MKEQHPSPGALRRRCSRDGSPARSGLVTYAGQSVARSMRSGWAWRSWRRSSVSRRGSPFSDSAARTGLIQLRASNREAARGGSGYRLRCRTSDGRKAFWLYLGEGHQRDPPHRVELPAPFHRCPEMAENHFDFLRVLERLIETASRCSKVRVA
jgi:hypothetical protein